MSLLFRDTRVSFDSHFLSSSLTEEYLTIWESDAPKPISTIKPGFSGGQDRHIVDPINHVIYSGTWEGVLTCFNYREQKVVWERRDLEGLQKVALSSFYSSSVFVQIEAPERHRDKAGVINGIAELSAKDGKTIWKSDRYDGIYLHPSENFIAAQNSGDDEIVLLEGQKKRTATIKLHGFAVMSVAFSKNLLAIAEGEEGVCIADYEGNIVTRFIPKGRQPNCIEVAFRGNELLVHDSWDASFVTIVRPETAEVISEYQRKMPDDICFIAEGSRFVDTSGNIFESKDGSYAFKFSA